MSTPFESLMAGHARARTSGTARPRRGERRPVAAVLTCTDERVSPPEIFDHAPAALYTVRVAGNVFSREVAGSLEIAVLRLRCPLVLVLGHSDCTAVRMARSDEPVGGAAHAIARRIRIAVRDLPPEAPLLQAVEANVAATVRALRDRSRALRERVRAGVLEIAGAVYALESGRVRRLAGP